MVKKLAQFGFTTNQAKVYLSIIQAGTISAGKIAKITLLHRQDIYKILPKLERKGLITKTIDKPFKLQVVPIETALKQLVLNEKEKSNKKIAELEYNLKKLVESLKEPQKSEADARFTLLTTDDSIRNIANRAFLGLTKEVKLSTSAEMLLAPLSEILQEIAKLTFQRKIKLFVLTKTIPENVEILTKMFGKLNFTQNCVVSKSISKTAFQQYLILDSKEVWIATELKTGSGFPEILWTNDKNIVQMYEEYFDSGWNDTNAVTVYPRNKKRKKGNLVLA
jgi:sugar-specific transcriptional regulator TrmB